jgi:hypothetical protein
MIQVVYCGSRIWIFSVPDPGSATQACGTAARNSPEANKQKLSKSWTFHKKSDKIKKTTKTAKYFQILKKFAKS